MYGYIPEDYTFAKEGISLLKINSLQLSTTCGYVYPAQAVAGWQSKHVYILLGINGVTWISNDTAIARYTQLINDILTYNPYVEDINVISVLPVAYSMETKSSVEDGRILNSEVDAFNSRLQSMAYDLGVHYIDVNSKLKNNYGCLPDNLTVDGLHLTQLGYEIVRDTLIENVK
jgi:lysophospholipase L1-like esterase